MIQRLLTPLYFRIVTQSMPINPYTHTHLPPKPYLPEPQLFESVAHSARDFRSWRKVPLPERKNKVQKFVQSVVQDKQILKPLIAEFTGKSYKDIEEEFRRIDVVAGHLIQASEIALKQDTKQVQIFQHKLKSKITHDPVGLTMIFPYYSEPIFDSLIHLIPCLVSGNGALLKVSDHNHFLGQYMNKKCQQILGYKNLINDTFIHPTQLPTLRQFRSIKKLNFSGSQSSARRIFQVMVENRFIDCNLFYGAQEAAYVDKTADLQLAAAEICHNAFYNNGQSYCSLRRLYIDSEVSDKLLQILTQKILQLKLGDPKSSDTDLGPITIQESVLRFEELILDAINMDARCLVGGVVVSDGVTKGMFIQPTLLVNCDPSMQVIQQQLNAPLLCASEVADFEQFCNEVNDNAYGTGIRIFTQDVQKYGALVDRLEVGIVAFNSGCIIDCDLPIEGWKGSGKGKILSQLSYEEYVVPKSFVISDPL